MRYEISRNRDGYLAVLCDGDRDLLMKRRVKAKPEALYAVASIMRYGGDPANYKVATDAQGLKYISLHSPSGRNLGFCSPVGSEEERDDLICICATASQEARIQEIE